MMDYCMKRGRKEGGKERERGREGGKERNFYCLSRSVTSTSFHFGA